MSDSIVFGAAGFVGPVDRPVTTIEGAGHHPQLTHPAELVRALGTVPAR